MSAQDDVLELEATSIGAFVRLLLPFWFVAAAVMPYDGGNQQLFTKSRRARS